MSYFTKWNPANVVKKRFGEAVLERLDRLTQEEARTTAAETLKVIYGLVQEMSEQARSACESAVC